MIEPAVPERGEGSDGRSGCPVCLESEPETGTRGTDDGQEAIGEREDDPMTRSPSS